MNNEPKDRIKDIHFDDEVHKRLHDGVRTMCKAVGSTYGPGGRNVIIQKKYVHPVQTRDGVTVARDIAGYGNKLNDPIANMAAQLVYQASEKTNKTAGDGTTATVVETDALYESGYKLIAAGEDAMVIKRKLDRDRDAIIKFVESKSQNCDKDKLKQVANISCGDDALAAMISDLVYDVGADGAITISYHNAPTVEVDKVTGYLFSQGFRHLAQEVEMESPSVLVTQKRIATKTDILPVLELAANNQKQVIIVGDVAGAALDTIVWALQNQKAEVVVIPPPAFGADGHDYFEDIATYTGARLILEGDTLKGITLDDLGTIKGARLNRDRSILYGDNKTGDAIAERIKAIKEQLDSSDVTPSLKEQLEQRYAKLAGKVSIIKVGATTEAEREELFFRVEDATEACKSALSSGIVAGGATTLLFASKQAGLEKFVSDALQEPFRLLCSNAALDGGFYLNKVLEAGYGKGYNLRNMDDKPVDLYKEGIVDPTKVIVQVVKNAFSIAGVLLTTGTTISEVDNEPVPQN
jgi:chaperonin GroEL